MTCQRWSEEEKALLRQLWTTAEIEAVLKSFPGRSEYAVRRTADRLGLRRPWEEIVKARSEAGKKSMSRLNAKREARRQEQESLELLQRVFIVPAGQAKAVNMARVLVHPLEAAWRGGL